MEIDNGLLEKYLALLAENSALREENELLKARLGITDPSRPNPPRDPENHLPLAYEAPDLPEKKPPRGLEPLSQRVGETLLPQLLQQVAQPLDG